MRPGSSRRGRDRTEDAGAAVARPPEVEDVVRTVQERLRTYRRDLYRGRGPGIAEEEWLQNTSLRGTVAGIPTAVTREELHVRTMRVRGERAASAEEATWAAAQFPGAREEFTALASPARHRRSAIVRLIGGLGLLGAALWRTRRRPPLPSSVDRTVE